MITDPPNFGTRLAGSIMMLLLSGGCSGQHDRPTPGSETIRPATKPMHASDLQYSIITDPQELWLNLMPGPGAGERPQPASLTLFFEVHNPHPQAYQGEARSTQVVRFEIRRPDGQVLHQSGDIAGMAITPVEIPPGQTVRLPRNGETARIDDLRPLRDEVLTITATFMPTGERISLRLPVQAAH